MNASAERADTVEINRRMTHFDGHSQVWLFGYGSLIYKADFPYIERRPASIRGWARRFWQGSHDHRGTPESPGRVVTLIAEPDATCIGMAYLISPQTFASLDVREKNGYLRLATELTLDDGRHANGLHRYPGKRGIPRRGQRTRNCAAHLQISRSQRRQ